MIMQEKYHHLSINVFDEVLCVQSLVFNVYYSSFSCCPSGSREYP
jgi:hypothetical protein